MKIHTVLADTFFHGSHRSRGSVLKLSKDQAEMLVKAGIIAEGELSDEQIDATLKKAQGARKSSK